MDAGGSILDGVIEKSVSNIVNSPRISEELIYYYTRCYDENTALESGCNGLSHDGFPGYNGSPHHICTSKVYLINSKCKFECFDHYKK